jgi:hypothetical protein
MALRKAMLVSNIVVVGVTTNFMYKWERDWFAPAASVVAAAETERVVEKPLDRQLQKIFDCERARGWKEIALVLGMHPVNVQRFYKKNASTFMSAQVVYTCDECGEPDSAVVVGAAPCIHKTGGRFWASPGELLNLIPEVNSRREGGPGRRVAARRKPRDPSTKRFKKTP